MTKQEEEKLLDNLTMVAVVLIFITACVSGLIKSFKVSATDKVETVMNNLDETKYVKEVETKIAEEKKEIRKQVVHTVTATIYTPCAKECDKSPMITADNSKINMKKLRSGQTRWIAVSRDLLAHYKYGDKVEISGGPTELNGIWEIRDTMHPRWKKRIDILRADKKLLGKWKNVKIQKL